MIKNTTIDVIFPKKGKVDHYGFGIQIKSQLYMIGVFQSKRRFTSHVVGNVRNRPMALKRNLKQA